MSPPPRSAPDADVTRDPAVGLLDRLVRDALDQGYLDAAARRRATPDHPGHPRSRPGRLWAAAGLAVIAAVVTVAAVQHHAGAPDSAQRKVDLASAITASGERVDGLESQLATGSAAVAALRDLTLSSGQEGQLAQARIDRLGPVVGTVAVTGPGLVVTVDDAPPDEAAIGAGEPDLGRVQDRDLQLLVNGLWQAGAEAIDVNGERMTALSAIRGAGAAVLVNYRPLDRPYVVTAIGDPSTLEARFASGPAGVELEALRQTYGVSYELQGRDRVTVPAEQGTMLRYAKEGVG